MSNEAICTHEFDHLLTKVPGYVLFYFIFCSASVEGEID